MDEKRTRREIMGRALKRYEKEQREWNARIALEKKNRGLRSPSYVPLRGLCLVAYYIDDAPEEFAKAVCVIVSHKLEGVHVPQVLRADEPVEA